MNYFFVTAADEVLEGLLEVVIEYDVDERVDYSMRICKHVDPELILYQPGWQLKKKCLYTNSLNPCYL